MSQEEFNNEVQLRLSVHEEKFNSLITKIDATNEKVDNLISEMRDRDNRRADEIAEIRQSIKEIYQTTDNKISEIRNLSYISLTAIAAMVITVLFNLPKG